MKPKKEFKAQNLRSLLAVLFAVLLVGGAGIFYLGIGMVREYATDVNQRLVDADASGKQIEELQVLKSKLSESTVLIDKANLLFASPGSYQSQVLNDLKNHADAAGVSLASTSFGDVNASGDYTVTISLEDPVSYTRLITFLSNIESNLPKLQVSSIALSHADGGADSIDVGEIKINVAVR